MLDEYLVEKRMEEKESDKAKKADESTKDRESTKQ
jgi:hypothetical protein